MTRKERSDEWRNSILYRVAAAMARTAGKGCARVDQLSFQPPPDTPIPIRENLNRAARRANQARHRRRIKAAKRRNHHAQSPDR